MIVRYVECWGGADRDRTDDPRLAKPVLFQLSYSPSVLVRDAFDCVREVGLARLELATSALSGLRSNHLSYRPSNALANPFAEGSPARQYLTVTDFQRPRIGL